MSTLHSPTRTNPTIHEKLESAAALRSAGRLADAVVMLNKPGEYDTRLCSFRAEMEFALGRFQDAAMSYFSVVMSDPDNTNSQFNLGLCLERCGRWDVAVQAFENVLRRDSDRSDARLGLGACLLHLNRPEEAVAIFDECGSLDPGPALIGKAVALQLLQRFDDADHAYSDLLAHDPDSEEALANVIAMEIETNDLTQVWDHSLRLLEIDPNSTVALKGLATVAFALSDHSAAASYCDRILELNPNCLEAWHNFRIAMDQSAFGSSEPAPALHTGGRQ